MLCRMRTITGELDAEPDVKTTVLQSKATQKNANQLRYMGFSAK